MILWNVAAVVFMLELCASASTTFNHNSHVDQWFVDAQFGDDTANGNINTPFQTVARAKHAVDEWRTVTRTMLRRGLKLPANATGHARVMLRGGVYPPLTLTERDGGISADRSVVYTAAQGERVFISAGFAVPNSAIEVVNHPCAGAQTKTQVLRVALDAFGFTSADYGVLRGSTASGSQCTNEKMEAHIGTMAMRLARYPNPWQNGTWQFMNVLKPASTQNTTQFVWNNTADNRPATWTDEMDPWLHGYFQFDWADTIGRISHLDSESHTVSIDPATPTYGNNEAIKPKARWLGLNLLCELDDEGEYWLNRTSGVLYLIPVGGANAITAAHVNLVVSVNATAVNSSASNVRFEALTVMHSQANGMELNGDNITVDNCTSTNHGAIGIQISGVNNTVVQCDIHDVGCAGIAVKSGVRQADLIWGNSTMMHNTIHRNSLWKRMYQPGIAFDSVGDRFEHNTMYDAPHSGMLGHAIGCLFAHNNFTQLCTESGDAGAWYSGRSWADRGNEISSNLFSRITNFGPPIPLQKPNVHGIHFDDQMSGYLVRNNTFVDSWVGIMLGGGRRTIIVNNTFNRIQHVAIEFDNRGMTWQKTSCMPPNGTFYKELAQDKVDQPPWSTLWPYLQAIAQDHPCVPTYNNISNNRYCACATWMNASPQDITDWFSVAEHNTNTSDCNAE
eukprot:m.12154 g.12154  ORF g.12154 m.12154 type:complete len:676 (+) comp9192_c0_seq1:195-2222(+)